MPDKMVIKIAETVQFQRRVNIKPQKAKTGYPYRKKNNREFFPVNTGAGEVAVIQEAIEQEQCYGKRIEK
jgi:hypothetical protein